MLYPMATKGRHALSIMKLCGLSTHQGEVISLLNTGDFSPDSADRAVLCRTNRNPLWHSSLNNPSPLCFSPDYNYKIISKQLGDSVDVFFLFYI